MPRHQKGKKKKKGYHSMNGKMMKDSEMKGMKVTKGGGCLGDGM